VRLALLFASLLAGPVLAADTLVLEGEVAAMSTAPISPPPVRNTWNFQITQIAADGSAVKQGQPVVTFDGSELQRRLEEAEGRLRTKQSELAKLLLDLAERERTEGLATAEQAAALVKAERKATQPAEIIRSVDYRKLVIEREQADRRAALVREREGLAKRQRAAERALLEADVAQAQADVDELTRAVALLAVPAPRDGVVVVRSNWRGERYEAGSQVFMGQTVAELPDPSTLVVRATLPERELLRLGVGMAARVQVQGGAGRHLAGKVLEIGRTVRTKSRQSPLPVVDVLVGLEGDTAGLKTGMPVSVEVVALRPAAETAP